MKAEMEEILHLLQMSFGPADDHSLDDVLGGLILTILSQNTNAANYSHAFKRLRDRFPTWEEAANAPPSEIEEAIRPAGLSRIKSERISRILNQIIDVQGQASLEHLRDLSREEVESYLLALDGVGPKTAACVLMFELGRDVFPVDTHVHRIAGRLGLSSPNIDPAALQLVLEEITPKGECREAHLQLVKLGRVVCHARKPKCEICPLSGICPYLRQ